MSINKTRNALVLALALVACSNDDKARNDVPSAAAPQQAASAQTAAAGTSATADTAAQAANPASAATVGTGNSAATVATAGSDAAAKPTDPAIQSQDLNAPGFVADLIEAKRSDGVLSVKLRLKNTGTKADQVKIYRNAKTEAFYVQAGSKKYMVLTDTEKAPLASASDAYDGTLSPSIQPGASFVWWAKYPAPPADVKKFSFYWPLGAPFDDVPITDK